jgi:Flp pilus assembly protein TadD
MVEVNPPTASGSFRGKQEVRVPDADEPTGPAAALIRNDAFDYDKIGMMQMRSGEVAAAEANFRAAIACNQNIASFHVNLGGCLARLQRLDDAINAVQMGVRLAPDDPASHTLLGDILLRAGQFGDAEAVLCRSLELRDGDIGVLHRLSIAIDRQGRYAEAVTVAERVAALEPDNPDYQARVGALCSMAGDYVGMERAYKVAIMLRPGNLVFHQSLIAALDRQGRDEELTEALRVAMVAGPNDAGLAEQFGSLMMARERWADAEKALRTVAVAQPNDFRVFHKLGIVLERQGKIDDAIEAAEQASVLAPDDDNLMFRLAVLSLNGRHFAGAEQALRHVIRVRPAAARLHHTLGVALERQGRFREALEEASKAWMIDPDDRGLQGRVVALEAKCSRGVPMVAKTYLIFAATGVGLGHLMGAILGSAFYAWETGRVFCMDMREVIFFGDDAHNAFFEHFRLVVPDGLEVITDLAVIETLTQEPDLHFLRLDTPLDIERPFPNKVVMVPCITPGDPFGPRVRQTDEPFRIELKGRLAEALSRSMSRPEWKRHVIGVHYRATVGELFDRMTRNNVPDYDERYDAVKDNYVVQAMGLVEGRASETYAFFVASDDRAFVSEMLSRLPNAFAFDSLRLDTEFAAYVRANKHDISILVDAVTDLWALSQCQKLIYSRSAFTHFAIMNSAHLDDDNTFYIHMPMFEEILDSVPPETAVKWARAAVRKIDLSRMIYEKMHHALARSLRRAGLDDEAAHYTKRARWHFEASHAPEIANPEVFTVRAQRRQGITDLAVQRSRRAIVTMPENPYLRGGYGGSLSTLLLQRGDLHGAVASAREAVALDPLDAFLHDHLGSLLAMSEDTEGAETSFLTALVIAADVASFHANLSGCFAQRGEMRMAFAAARRAAELDPDNAKHRARCEALVLVQEVTLLVR